MTRPVNGHLNCEDKWLKSSGGELERGMGDSRLKSAFKPPRAHEDEPTTKRLGNNVSSRRLLKLSSGFVCKSLLKLTLCVLEFPPVFEPMHLQPGP
mmetsp:Transcript_43721/g.74361  ORF Transcript_43721/g.74361 Transcript_43721/m.74361 type:complete len:96 (-) Transcript_43721:47-334(-)